MRDENKTKKQLIEELTSVRKRLDKANGNSREPAKADEEDMREMSLALSYAMPGIARLDQKGEYIRVNEMYAKMLGYKPAELLATDCTQFIHPEDQPPVDIAFQRMVKRGLADFEVRRIHKDGSVCYHEILIVKRTDKSGNFVGHNCFAKDITRRRESEDQIAHLQQFYSYILDKLPLQMAVFDLNRRFQYISPAAVSDAKMRKWLIGKTEFDYCRKRKVSEKIAQVRKAAFDASVRTKSTQTLEEEFPSRKKGLRYMVRSFSPVIDEENNVSHVIGYSMDITEKKIADRELQEAHDELENRVRARTAELTSANKALKQEIRERKKTAEELKNSEERLKILFEYAPDVYYLHDLAGNFVGGNKAAEKLSGYRRDELIGKSFFKANILAPQYLPRAVANLTKNAMGKPTGPEEFVLIRKNGEHVPLEIRTHPVKIKNQTFVLGNARDMTARRRAEKDLRLSKARYHNIFETAAVSIWEQDYSKLKSALDKLKRKGVKDFRKYIDKHPEFLTKAVGMIEVLDVNDATLKLYRAEKKSQLLGPLNMFLIPETFKSFKEQIITMAEGGNYFETETVNQTLDGNLIDILLRINIPSETDKFSNVLISIMDITARKRTEEALKESEERFSKAFHNTPAALCINQLNDERFSDVNNRFLEMFGYERSDIIGQKESDLKMFIDAEDRQKMQMQLDQHSFIRDFETQVMTKEGKLREVLVAVELIELGGRPCALSMIEDVTERNRAMEAKERLRLKTIRSAAIVEAQEKERRRISRELHDGIGQILTAVKFNFESLEETLNTETQEQADIIREIKYQLNNAVSEGERISYNLMPRVLDDFGIIPTLERLCQQITQHSGTTIKFYSHKAKERLKSNIEMGLYRIAQEALNNVVKHADAREAMVQIVHHPESVNLVIEDDGRGFGPNETEKNGKGMGLINMNERAEALKGTLTIDSKPSSGTTILVEIPLIDSHENN